MLIEGGSPSAFDFAALGKFERGLLERERYSCFFYQSKILKTTIQYNYCDICSEERHKVTESSLQMPLTIFYKILTVA